MAQVSKSVVKAVAVKDLQVGDKLLVSIVGYKENVLFHQGTTLNPRDIAFIKKKLDETIPQLSDQQILTEKKSVIDIKDSEGKVLVVAGDLITEDALQPLLKQGFKSSPMIGSASVIFSKPQEWPKDIPWHIAAINPTVKIETMVLINDEIQEVPEPERDKKPAAKRKDKKETATAGKTEA